MKDTGEQFIPGISSKRLFDEHVLRYDFVKKFCTNKEVLDIACGTGYGTNEIAKVAKSAIGVDISVDSIKFANLNYKRENLSFLLDDVKKLTKIGKKEFDVVVSFETIEHLDTKGREAFFNNIKKLLKPGGLFMLSTPNKKITSPFSQKPLNKFHVIEFTRDSLEKELITFFDISKWYGQRFIINILTLRFVRLLIRAVEKGLRRDFGLYTTFSAPNVLEWNNAYKQPRIMILISKHKNNV